MVFNLFHAATQFDLTTPFRKFPVCTKENHNDQNPTYDITTLNKDSYIKFMHMAASVRDPCRTQINPQHNSLKTRITTKLAAAFRYLTYKHSAFLRHKVLLCVTKCNSTVKAGFRTQSWEVWKNMKKLFLIFQSGKKFCLVCKYGKEIFPDFIFWHTFS